MVQNNNKILAGNKGAEWGLATLFSNRYCQVSIVYWNEGKSTDVEITKRNYGIECKSKKL